MKTKFHLVYKTTTTPFFPICLIAKAYSGNFKKLIGERLSPKKIITLISEGAVNWFFDESLGESAEKIFTRFFTSPKYIQELRKKEKDISQKILKEIKTPVEELFFDKILNKQGEEKLQRIFQYYTLYGTFVDTPGFLFQLYLTDKIKKEIFQRLNKTEEEKNEIFNFLLSSYKKTNFERFLFALAKNLNKEKQFEKIAQSFYWVIHDYLGEIIDLRYIKNKAREFKKNREELNLYLKGSLERIKKIKQIKKELPKDLLQKINIIQEILYLYNEGKKEVLNQVNIYLRKIIEYKFAGISTSKIRIFYQITPEEIIKLLKDEKINDLKTRNQKWVYLIENEIIKSAPKRDFKKYFSLLNLQKETKILKGMPASSGIVKGKVNIILNISHIHNFREGDILVAPFTNVNYLPIMNKAKAILTETGGLTSHAAIVSRELKKPCIVGIKGLLLVLKDGDLVEVDAEKGVVRILKKSR